MFAPPPLGEMFPPDRWLEDGDTASIGNEILQSSTAPATWRLQPGRRAPIVGDVLFRGSIGRTDFPQRQYTGFINVIRTKLFFLPDDAEPIPEHGPMSALGEEKASNPIRCQQEIRLICNSRSFWLACV